MDSCDFWHEDRQGKVHHLLLGVVHHPQERPSFPKSNQGEFRLPNLINVSENSLKCWNISNQAE